MDPQPLTSTTDGPGESQPPIQTPSKPSAPLKSGPGNPFVVGPAAGTSKHTHTVILLHGLGSNGVKFGEELLATGVASSGRSLASLLPGAKFIFPTAKRRRSSAFGRSMLTQWFDVASLDDPLKRKDKQLKGLAESHAEISELVEREAALVGRENVLLGGISMGCAMGLIALLAATPRGVGGFMGMSGWLPLRDDLEDVARAATPTRKEGDGGDDDGDNVFGSDDENPFQHNDDGDDDGEHKDGGRGRREKTPSERVGSFVREILSLDTGRPGQEGPTSATSTPVFLGHGGADEKIKPRLGEEARGVLEAVGFDVTWKRYEDLGHWYKIPDEIDDIAEFIRSKMGWELAG
ncbi:acyl-protein thioesterase [Cladorrhinum samala]|uniref:Acyl-protein thioesterase n=1 Tax=Cladorrhinum samala TaxID=585594 RepID=A0AAV9H918_9PEZI|nr:acyl-protein thioesterase [Cladorrhinum samala]